MKKHLLFITEGVDDVAIISAIIEHLKVAKEKNHLKDIDAFWKDKLIPQKYPFKKDKLDRVSPVPNFYEGEQLSIAIKAAHGENNIFKELGVIFDIYKVEELKQIDGIFILCDADEMQADEKLAHLLEVAIENGDIDLYGLYITRPDTPNVVNSYIYETKDAVPGTASKIKIVKVEYIKYTDEYIHKYFTEGHEPAESGYYNYTIDLA